MKDVAPHKLNHVKIYDRCSFLKEILVCPPIGPSGTSNSSVASKRTGKVPAVADN